MTTNAPCAPCAPQPPDGDASYDPETPYVSCALARDTPYISFDEFAARENAAAIYESMANVALELGAAQCYHCKLWFHQDALEYCSTNCFGQMYCADCRHQCQRCKQYFCFECEFEEWVYEGRLACNIKCKQCWAK